MGDAGSQNGPDGLARARLLWVVGLRSPAGWMSSVAWKKRFAQGISGSQMIRTATFLKCKIVYT